MEPTETDETTQVLPRVNLFAVLRWAHNFAGGACFLASAICYMYPLWAPSGDTGAWMYAIGSGLYMLLDAREWVLALPQTWCLRINMTFGVWGTMLFTAGSIGYLPSVSDQNSDFGPWASAVGAALASLSCGWKCVRVACNKGVDRDIVALFSLRRWFDTADSITMVASELCCAVGWLLFAFPNWMYEYGDVSVDSYYFTVVRLWVAGAVLFVISGFIAAYRCFGLGV